MLFQVPPSSSFRYHTGSASLRLMSQGPYAAQGQDVSVHCLMFGNGLIPLQLRHRRSSHGPPHLEHRPSRDLADADLQRAIRLSLEEVNGQGQHRRPGYVPYQPDSWQRSEPPLVEHASRPPIGADEDDDPDLKAAIEASLSEANAPKPSAPTGLETPRAQAPSLSPGSYFPATTPTHPAVPALPNYDLAPLESDTIMTFSQTIEEVQAQGGRDLSRFPAVTQLFDNANSLRPKLAMSLDDTGRKEGTPTRVFMLWPLLILSAVSSELLTEMNNKLAQAVKLYDHILTQQVSRPTWRQQPATPPAQPLGQWNSVQSPTFTQPTNTPMTEPWHQPSSSYTSPQAYQPATGAGPSYAPPSHSPPQTWIQSSYISSVASPPPIATASQGSPQYHPSPTPQSSASHQYQYAHPIQSVSIQQPRPPVRAATSMITPPQQPTPVAAQPPSVHRNMSSTLSMHRRQQSLPQPSQPQQPLSRHNTVAHVTHVSPLPPQQRYPPASAPAPAPVLPNFPTVPTAPPSIPYGSYDSVSSAVEQPKKEALLIEL
jgi:hepatocyte growth factor-regulated tyrosine kinase substrate